MGCSSYERYHKTFRWTNVKIACRSFVSETMRMKYKKNNLNVYAKYNVTKLKKKAEKNEEEEHLSAFHIRFHCHQCINTFVCLGNISSRKTKNSWYWHLVLFLVRMTFIFSFGNMLCVCAWTYCASYIFAFHRWNFLF